MDTTLFGHDDALHVTQTWQTHSVYVYVYMYMYMYMYTQFMPRLLFVSNKIQLISKTEIKKKRKT